MKKFFIGFVILVNVIVAYAQGDGGVTEKNQAQNEAYRSYVNNATITYCGKKTGKPSSVSFFKISLTEDSKCYDEGIYMNLSIPAIISYDNLSPMYSYDKTMGIGSRIKDYALILLVKNNGTVPVSLDLSESQFVRNGDSRPIVDKSLFGDDDAYRSRYIIKLKPGESKMLDYMYLDVLSPRTSYGGPKNTTYLALEAPTMMLGEHKEYTYDQSPYKYSVSLTYSSDLDNGEKSMLNAGFYVSDIIAGTWDSMLNTVKMKDLNIVGHPLFFFGSNKK